MVKEKTKREWENFFLGQSYTISSYFTSYLMTENQWTIMEKLQELAGELLLSKQEYQALMNENSDHVDGYPAT